MAGILILFITEAIPLAVTAVLGAVAMAAFGVIEWSQAFAGFSNDAVMLVIGMLIIGRAVNETGLVTQIGGVLRKLTIFGERATIGLFTAITGGVSAFFSNTATTALMLPVVDSVSSATNNPSLRTKLYMPIGVAATMGGLLTLVGSVPQLAAQGLLESAGVQTLEMFTLFKGGFPLFLIGIVYFMTVGRHLLGKCVPEGEGVEEAERAVEQVASELPKDEPSKVKMAITGITFLCVVIAFIAGVWTTGAIAMTGALVLIITRCIDLKACMKIDWSPMIILGGSLGFSVALDQSGAGAMIADFIINLCGGDAASPLVIFAVIIILAGVLSLFMANTATVVMLVPIGIVLAQTMGFNPLAIAIGIIYAANIDFATPVGAVPMTLTLAAGYKFVDYIKVCGPLWAILLAGVIAIVPVAYSL